jgi:myosin heavy subunit
MEIAQERAERQRQKEEEEMLRQAQNRAVKE